MILPRFFAAYQDCGWSGPQSNGGPAYRNARRRDKPLFLFSHPPKAPELPDSNGL